MRLRLVTEMVTKKSVLGGGGGLHRHTQTHIVRSAVHPAHFLHACAENYGADNSVDCLLRLALLQAREAAHALVKMHVRCAQRGALTLVVGLVGKEQVGMVVVGWEMVGLGVVVGMGVVGAREACCRTGAWAGGRGQRAT